MNILRETLRIKFINQYTKDKDDDFHQQQRKVIPPVIRIEDTPIECADDFNLHSIYIENHILIELIANKILKIIGILSKWNR